MNQVRVAIAGLGTVGDSVCHLLQTRRFGPAITITGVSARDRTKHRKTDLADIPWYSDPIALAESDHDVFIELIGGEGGIAQSAVEAAISAGHHVITANKAMMAVQGAKLAKSAEDAGVALKFESAVAAGLPVVKCLREGLRANTVTRVVGILNGTCNFVLTQMQEKGEDLATALRRAQEYGFAEQDPTLDIDGTDTAQKIALLAALAFQSAPASHLAHVEGIADISQVEVQAAARMGFVIRLLGSAARRHSLANEYAISVFPAMVPANSLLAEVKNSANAVLIETDLMKAVTMIGAGAGAQETASGILADLLDICAGSVGFPFGVSAKSLGTPSIESDPDASVHRFACIFAMRDRPNAFAEVARCFGASDISFDHIEQGVPGRPGARISGQRTVLVTTHPTQHDRIQTAITRIESTQHLVSPPRCFRVESP